MRADVLTADRFKNLLLKSSEFRLKNETVTAYNACCGFGGAEVAAVVSAVAIAWDAGFGSTGRGTFTCNSTFPTQLTPMLL